jgi:magnesium-transporting ATPase (P-type)
MDPTTIPATTVAERLGTDPETGLVGAEAARLLASHGPNTLVRRAPTPWWRKALHQFADPLVYLLLVAVAVSVIAWVIEGADGLPVDALVIVAVLLLNAAIGLAQERRAEDAVAALSRLTAATATVVRDGGLVQVPAAELVPGDLLHLSEGDAVGADGRLVSVSGLRVLESALTGESEAVTKDPRPLAAPAGIGDRGLIAGTAALTVGRTVGFTTLVLAQLFNAFNSRSMTASVFSGLFANRWLWAAAGLAILLQVAITEVGWLQVAFQTASLSPAQWLISVACASTVLWVEELRKLVLRILRRP